VRVHYHLTLENMLRMHPQTISSAPMREVRSGWELNRIASHMKEKQVSRYLYRRVRVGGGRARVSGERDRVSGGRARVSDR